MEREIGFAVICTTLLVLLLVAVIIIVFFISGKQRISHEIETERRSQEFERELRQVETEVSEQVMGQFAQELHDNIGQLLTAMQIQMENQKLDHSELAESFKPVEIYLGEATQQLRLLSRTLNHDYIGHIGLFAAIQLEVERTNSLKRFKVYWEPVSGVSNLSRNQELLVFRIFQEIIQNALRHSSAKNLVIAVENRNGLFGLKIKDDGNGYNLEKVLQSQKAFGLRNIFKRAILAGLECKIDTSEGNGSIISLKKLNLPKVAV
jgi:signal transduction histidine kinase